MWRVSAHWQRKSPAELRLYKERERAEVCPEVSGAARCGKCRRFYIYRVKKFDNRRILW